MKLKVEHVAELQVNSEIWTQSRWTLEIWKQNKAKYRTLNSREQISLVIYSRSSTSLCIHE